MSKRRYKKKAIPVRIGELATIERCRQQGGVLMEAVDRDVHGKAIMKRHRAISECVLDMYFLRELINEAEYEAGMQLRKAYLRAALHIKVADNTGSHGDIEMPQLTLLHSERLLREAYNVLSGAEKEIVISVCGHDDWVGGNYRFQSLHSGLQKLANLWGFEKCPLKS